MSDILFRCLGAVVLGLLGTLPTAIVVGLTVWLGWPGGVCGLIGLVVVKAMDELEQMEDYYA